MAKVRIVATANWKGQPLRPGQEVEMDDDTAQAYVNVGQAVLLEKPVDVPVEKPAAESAKKKTKKAPAQEAEADTSET